MNPMDASFSSNVAAQVSRYSPSNNSIFASMNVDSNIERVAPLNSNTDESAWGGAARQIESEGSQFAFNASQSALLGSVHPGSLMQASLSPGESPLTSGKQLPGFDMRGYPMANSRFSLFSSTGSGLI